MILTSLLLSSFISTVLPLDGFGPTGTHTFQSNINLEGEANVQYDESVSRDYKTVYEVSPSNLNQAFTKGNFLASSNPFIFNFYTCTMKKGNSVVKTWNIAVTPDNLSGNTYPKTYTYNQGKDAKAECNKYLSSIGKLQRMTVQLSNGKSFTWTEGGNNSGFLTTNEYVRLNSQSVCSNTLVTCVYKYKRSSVTLKNTINTADGQCSGGGNGSGNGGNNGGSGTCTLSLKKRCQTKKLPTGCTKPSTEDCSAFTQACTLTLKERCTVETLPSGCTRPAATKCSQFSTCTLALKQLCLNENLPSQCTRPSFAKCTQFTNCNLSLKELCLNENLPSQCSRPSFKQCEEFGSCKLTTKELCLNENLPEACKRPSFTQCSQFTTCSLSLKELCLNENLPDSCKRPSFTQCSSFTKCTLGTKELCLNEELPEACKRPSYTVCVKYTQCNLSEKRLCFDEVLPSTCIRPRPSVCSQYMSCTLSTKELCLNENIPSQCKRPSYTTCDEYGTCKYSTKQLCLNENLPGACKRPSFTVCEPYLGTTGNNNENGDGEEDDSGCSASKLLQCMSDKTYPNCTKPSQRECDVLIRNYFKDCPYTTSQLCKMNTNVAGCRTPTEATCKDL
uniref:Ig-like domain-containing protein n=1 Tax=Parastrongyloides trichosuri TaxID=131310 RepID=A0A0N4ZI51_PARTI